MKSWLILALLASSGLVGCNAPAAAQVAIPQIVTSPAPADDSLSHDDSHCTTCDGVRLLNEGDFARAMRIFRQEAAKGDCVAVTNIGSMFQYGLGRPVDALQAAQWYIKAAGQGCGVAARNVAAMYQAGEGMPADPQEALKWYLKAVDLGDGGAATSAGYFYEHGIGVLVDYAKAMQLYQVGASAHDPVALNQIGFMLQHGLGMPAEPDAAYAYYKMAEAQGNERAPVHIQERIASGTLNPRTLAAHP
jgi:hypothetical protein